MKTTIAAASLVLTFALSGLSTAHAAGFNDRSVAPNVTTSVSSRSQNLSHVPVVQGFNQRSHIAAAALEPTANTGRAPLIAGIHCDLAPNTGFQNSSSLASC